MDLLSVLESSEFFSAYKGKPVLWDRGGCWVLADTIAGWLGPSSEVVGIYRRTRRGRVVFDHAIVKVGDWFIDGSGVKDAEDTIEEQKRLTPIGDESWIGELDRTIAERNVDSIPDRRQDGMIAVLTKRLGDGPTFARKIRG